MIDSIKKIQNSECPFFANRNDTHYDEAINKIIIMIEDEAVTESIAKQYEEFFDSISLTMDDVLIFHSNANLNRKKGYYFFDYFFMECRRVLEKTNYKYGKIDYNVQKEKIYNCLNHSANQHRTFVFDNLKSKGLLKKGFVSYVDNGMYLPTNFENNPTEDQDWRWSTILPEIISKTYFNVVTETHHDIEPDFDSLFITEKICKALITQPFILVGNVGMLKYIKDLGFKTYSELFDESYDSIKNPVDRLNFVLNELERVCNMDIEELERIYKSVLWKVEYNRNRMINFKDDNYAVSKVANWQWTL
jgi:hypothetical protein